MKCTGGRERRLMICLQVLRPSSVISTVRRDRYVTDRRTGTNTAPAGIIASMLILLYSKPPLPGWAWAVLIIGGLIAFIVDRFLDWRRNR